MTWTGRTIPNTSWAGRPAQVSNIYDSTVAYDSTMTYESNGMANYVDRTIPTTSWTARIIPA